MESVPAPAVEDGEKYLDENAEQFRPDPATSPVPDAAGFEVALAGLARELGFVRIGIARAEPFVEAGQRFKDWVERGYAGTMEYLAEFGDRHLPGRLLANARSVVVAAAALPSSLESSNVGRLNGRVADYALGLDYHIALRSRLRRIGQGLADLSGRSVWTRPCIDTAPLLEREAARRAGIGFIAKSTMLIVNGVGPRVLLAALVTDLELEAGLPQESRCGRCTACIDACPTGALVKPYELDSRRCLSYLNIEHQGQFPVRYRSMLENRVIGCDICQSVCPYDRVDAATVMPSDAGPRPLLVAPELSSWLSMTASDYRRITKRSALRRVGRVQLMRNAAIALGNSGSAVAQRPLVSALESNRIPTVRAHAAWGLGQLGGTESRAALERALTGEHDEGVLEEIRAALVVVGSSEWNQEG
jgi:epoxyqueuosine reductase